MNLKFFYVLNMYMLNIKILFYVIDECKYLNVNNKLFFLVFYLGYESRDIVEKNIWKFYCKYYIVDNYIFL